VVVVCLIFSTASVLDVVAIALLTLHDAVDGAMGVVLTVVLRTTLQLPLIGLAVALVDVAASVTGMPIVVDIVAKVVILNTSTSRLIGFVLVDLLLDGWKDAMPKSIGSTTRMTARRTCDGFGGRALLRNQGRGDPNVGHGCFSIGREIGLLETCHGGAKVGLRAVERR
jgi:hypothetical protein